MFIVVSEFHLVYFITMSPLQVVRNPFDIIATTYVYSVGGADLRAKLSGNSNMTLPTEERVLDCKIEHHAMEISALESMADNDHSDTHRVYEEDMVLNPQEEIQKLCKFLELECSQKYIDNCAAAIFPFSSKSRYHIQWTKQQVDRVVQLIESTPYLEKYLNDL